MNNDLISHGLYRLEYLLLVFILLLLPFTSLPVYSLGQSGHEGGLYPAIAVFIVFIVRKYCELISTFKIRVFDNSISTIILLIFVLVAVSFVANINDISNSEYMGRYGLGRFVEQFFLLLVGFVVAFSFADIVNTEERLSRIIFVIYLSVAVFVCFAVFQFIAYTFGGYPLYVYKIIGKYIYKEGIVDFAVSRRHALHSFTQEPSHLGMYVGVVGPFVASYSFINKKYVVFFMMILVLLLSLSRTGYVMLLIEGSIFFYLLLFRTIKVGPIAIFSTASLVFIASLLAMTPVGDVVLSLFDVSGNGSNAARYAAAYSALVTWYENGPALGVGLGQTGFFSYHYIPDFGCISLDVVDTLTQKRWPPIHDLLIRILAETGLVGVLLWLILYSVVLFKVYRIFSRRYVDEQFRDFIGYGVIVSVFASILTMFSSELFTRMTIWVSLGLSFSYINIYRDVLTTRFDDFT